jgi:hypothetical protein
MPAPGRKPAPEGRPADESKASSEDRPVSRPKPAPEGKLVNAKKPASEGKPAGERKPAPERRPESAPADPAKDEGKKVKSTHNNRVRNVHEMERDFNEKPPVTAKKGDKGKEVRKLQNLLLWISPGCLPRFGADSEYGNETYNAVKVCQSILGVTVDGLWGKKSQLAAREYKK